jgi:hypothetical protein
MRKRVLTLLLALTMCLGLCAPAMASEVSGNVPTKKEVEAMFPMSWDMPLGFGNAYLKQETDLRDLDKNPVSCSGYFMTTQTVTLTILNQAASEEFGVVFAFQAFENDGTGVYNALKDWGTDFDKQEGYLSLLATDPSIDIPIGGDEFAGRDVIIMMYMLIGFFPKDGEKVMYNEVFFFKPGMVTVTPIPETPEVSTDPVTAAPTASTVLVNGEKKAFDAYNIEGSNYFKLRDLAYVLNGTDKQFEVGWDAAANAISLTSGKAYTAAGGEMAAQESPAQAEAVRSSSKILLDGAEVALTAYTINGNNYFKLRDLGQAFDFGVGWDGEAQTISIDTSTGYTAE